MRLRTLVMTASLALLLAGCGVRGSLELPPSATTPEAAPGEAAAPQAAAPVDDRSFILDGLLL